MAGLADELQDEREARMVLSMIAEPGDAVTGRVLALAGAVGTVRLLESQDTVPLLGRADAMIWRDQHARRMGDGLLEALDHARQAGYGTLIPTDPDWPAGVNDLTDRAPYVLWTLGNETLLGPRTRETVTVTGTRAATSYGERVASDFAGQFAAAGKVVVGGGDFGIEGAAHRGVLAHGGDTIAVLPGGLDRPYPRAHADLLDRIGDRGLLVTELPPQATPTRTRFLARSRLMAAMAGATVLVESGPRSGALGTASHAHALGRVVGAVPGPVTSAASAGPHQLIAAGTAMLTSDARQIADALDAPPPPAPPNPFHAQHRSPQAHGPAAPSL